MNAVEVNKEIEQQYWLLEALPVAALISRREDGQVLYANERFGALAGKPPAELVGHVTPDFYYDPAERTALLATLQERGLVQDYEMRGRRLSDGSPVWLSLVVQAVTYQGEAAYLTTLMDITEHKQAEIALAQSESQYRVLAENIQDGVFIIQNAKMIFANQAFADIVGYTVEEIIGMEFTRLIAPEDLPKVAESYRRRQAGEPVPPTYEWRMLRKDGVTRVDVNMTVGLVQLGGQVASLGTVKDITERKRAEAERERYTRQLNVAAEIAARVQAILDPDELLQAVIPLIKERFGLYYVHVYTLAGETLELRAGYGEPGRIMVAQGHRIPLAAEQSLVARAARTQVPVLVNDVTAEPDFLPNPLLPQTKSEVAVPAIAGGKVLGVFDVQHDTPGYFTEADLDVFRTLAGQIAVALENAQLFEAQRQAEAELRYRARFENLITTISSRFVDIAPEELDRGINEALRSIGEFAEVDRSYLFQYSPDLTTMDNTHEWCAPGIQSHIADLQQVPVDTFPWLWERFKRLEVVHIPKVTALPSEAAAEQKEFLAENIQSIILVPITYRGVLTGFLGFDAVQQEKIWTEEEAALLRMMGETFINALARRRTEIALHENEQRFRALIENSSDLITIVSPEGLIAYQSPSLKRILGYEPEELIGRSVVEFIPPETVPGIAALLAGIGQQPGAVVHAEYIFRHKDGSWRTMEGSAQASTVAGIAGIVVNSRDVTERKAAEQTLRESEEKFRVLADNIAVGIFVHQDGIIKYLGHEAARLLGYSDPAEVAGRSILDLIHPDERERVGTIARRRVAGEAVPDTYESRLLRKDGTAMDVMMYSSIISYEGRPATQGAFLDITERKQAEKAMQLDDIRQRALLRLSQMAEAPLKEILDYAIEEFGHITDSPISYLAFVNADESVMTMHAWSGGAMAQCKIIDKPIVYPVVTTGLWGEAIRQRRAIITNDYDEPNPWKRGYPQGHVEVKRHMNAPIFDGEHIVMVVGVGNKPEDYTDSDVQQLTLLATGLWQIIQRKQADEERERYTQRLSVAAEIAARVQAILDPDELLQAVIPLIKERFGLYYVHVYTLEGETLKLRAGYGEPGRIMVEQGHSIPLAAEKSLVARAARTQEVVVVGDVTAAPDFLPNPLLPETRSEVAVPAIAAGKVIGVFDVQHDVPDYFTEADLEVFQTLAAQIAIAFQNAEFVHNLQARDGFLRRQAQVLGSLSASVAITGGDLQTAFHELSEAAAQVVGVARASIWLFDEQRTKIVCADLFEQGKGHSAGLELRAVDYPAYFKALAGERIVAATDTHTDPATHEFSAGYLTPLGIGALLDVPIFMGGTMVGVLCHEHIGGDRTWSLEEQAFATSIVDWITSAMQAHQRKQTAEQLRASQTMLQIVMDNFPGVIFWKDQNSVYLGCNQAFATAAGLTTPAEIVGKTDYDLPWAQTEAEAYRADDQQVMQSEIAKLHIVETQYQADGNIVWFDTNKIPLRDATGHVIGVLGTSLDITALKQAEQAQAQLAAILEGTSDLVSTATPDGRITYMNRAGRQLVGWSETEDLSGYRIADLHPGWVQQLVGEAAIPTAVAQGLWTGETALLRKDGSEIPVSQVIIAHKSPTGELLYLSTIMRDITERKQAEQAVRESQQRLSLLVAQTPLAVIEWDLDFQVRGWNTAAEQIFGYTAEEAMGRHAAGLMVPVEARPLVDQVWQALLKQQGGARSTNDNFTKDGRIISCEWFNAPLVDANGDTIGVVSLVMDVTERKRAEQALRLTRSSVEASPDAFYWFDTEARFIDVNETTLRLLGYTREELLQLSVFDVDPGFPREAWEPLKAQLKAQGTVVLEGINQTKSGVPIPVEVVVSYVQFGEQEIYFSIARDITERKQAEQALREAEARQRQVLGTVPVSLVVSRVADGTILYANEQFSVMFGKSAADMLGQTTVDLYYDPAERQQVVSAVQTEGRLSHYELRLKRLDDGRVFWSDLSIDPFELEGEPVLLSAFFDITERKQAEAERERYAQRLSVAAEIAARVQAILDPDELLQAVIPLIKERFGLYYVHVYTLEGEALKLRAGYGEPGRIMVERGHSIPLEAEKSLVARAARTHEVVVVEDVTTAPDFLPNPLLPETRSEVAVPAIAGGQVIGVFDVQHDVPGYFTEADLDVFRALAGQIATAFQNASLYVATEASAARNRALLQTIPDMMFVFDAAGIFQDFKAEAGQELLVPPELFLGKPLGTVLPPQIAELTLKYLKQVLATGEPVTYEYQVPLGETMHSYEARMSRVGTDQVLALVRDITERKQAEERIQRSELLLRTVFNSVYDGIFLHTAEGAIVDVNDKILEMYGVSREEATRLSIADDYSSPDNPLDQLGVLWQRVMAGQPQLFEWKAKRPHDGTTFDAEVFLRRVTLGGRDMVLANVRDITERKQAEAAVAGERDFSNALINSLPVIFYLYDQAGSLVRWNRRYEEVLGYTPAEMPQVKVLDTIAEQDRALIVARMNEVFTTGYAEAEAHLLSKTGRQVPYLVTGTRLAVGDQVYLVGAAIDLTERKRAEAQRERFVTQLSTAAEISAQVGAILDTDELLDEVIPLLKERFNLYHVHFYVMDEARQELVLRAGYGQVGRIMRQQGFKITLDQEQSLVARAARTRQIALANDVTQDPDFMPNLLLPDTRAEVAVPAMIGDRLLGVFDVQSDQADYFTESDLDVYRTLAGQIANAFQSARLFEQQRQAEAAQREAAEKIRAMFDAMTEGITVTNMMGKIEDLNEATLRLYGYSGRDDLLGRSSMQLFTRPFWSKAAESVRRALETGTSQTAEYRMVRRDGSEFEAEMNAALLHDATGAPSGFVSIIRDITARKRAEEERARLTAQLRTAADISTQVASILDPQALFSRVVSLIKERFDIYHVQVYVVDEETQELVLQAGYGEPGRVMVARGHRIPLNTERSLVARAARTKEVVVVDDVTKAPDHLPNPLLPLTRSEVAVPAVYGDRVLGVFDVQDDEPARFGPAELDVFRTLAGQIATAFQNAGYVEELQHVAERFRELDRLKSEFLANMSHELRTPLNSIIGYAEVLLMGIDGELEGDTLEDVKAIHENGQHLLSMINDVLDLAKIEAGRMVLKMEEVEVDQLLDEVKSSGTGLLRKYQRTEAVELRIASEPDLPLLHADRIRLNQVLNNLISNAMKFTEHGYVQVRAYRSDPWVCIEVADSGIGIPANQLEQIFEKFRQVDGSSKRRAEGTGLGLAITRYLVEMHGGTIEVSSELGKGSVFTVRLPIQTAPADPEGGAG